jgi:peptidoglycan/xylan/chitin deacetylase (PgdA/CDA1 family)
MYKKTIIKKIIKLVFPALLHTKAHLLFRLAYSGVGSILMFHRVCPEVTSPRLRGNSGLEVTPEYLEKLIIYFSSKGYEFLSLDDVYKRLSEKKFKKKFLAFTFDDGYADNYEFAYPILKKHGIPSTIYLSTNYPDHKIGPWWCSLEELLLKNDSLNFDLAQKTYKFKTVTLPDKEEAFIKIRYLLMAGREDNPGSRINEFFSFFHIDPAELAKELMLSWEQIIELSKDPRIDFGAHTINHFPLNKLSQEIIKHEVLESQKKIESMIQRKVSHFSYPFGSNDEVNEREFAILKECGFKTSTTTRWGNIFPDHVNHLECLPRIHVNEKREPDFRLLTLSVNGAIPCVMNKFKRVITI